MYMHIYIIFLQIVDKKKLFRRQQVYLQQINHFITAFFLFFFFIVLLASLKCSFISWQKAISHFLAADWKIW